MIDIKHLRAFLAVVEAAHQGRAAKALGVQQSTLSRQIAALEDQLGISLFERDHSGLRLTGAGASFLVGVRRTLFEFDRAISFAARSGRAEAGHLAIGFLISLAAGPQREIITGFASRWKDVRLDFLEAGREELLELLRDRQLDLAFLPGRKQEAGLETLPLWTERFYVAIPEEHRLAHADRIGWIDLAGESLMLRAYERAAEVQAFLVSKLAGEANGLTIRQFSISRESLINLVSMRQGIAIATDALQGVSYPGVVFRPIEEPDAQLVVSLVYVLRNGNPILTTFRAFARQFGSDWQRQES